MRAAAVVAILLASAPGAKLARRSTETELAGLSLGKVPPSSLDCPDHHEPSPETTHLFRAAGRGIDGGDALAAGPDRPQPVTYLFKVGVHLERVVSFSLIEDQFDGD